MKKFNFPHPLTILLFFIGLSAVLTHLIPAGSYDRVTDPKTGREVVVSNSYKQVEAEPIGVFDAIIKVPEGIIFGADLVVLILIIGGAFIVVDKTGAFNDGISALIRKFEHAKSRVMILVGIVFATAGALNHTFEEIIAMIPFLVAMAGRLGYTKISAIAISAGCASIGAAFSPINPFGVLIAQKISEVTPFSGAWFRIIVLLIVLTFWIWWVLRNGKDEHSEHEVKTEDDSSEKLPTRSAIILYLILFTFAFMVYGIMTWDWGYNEMSALFLVTGFAAGLIGQLGLNGTSKAYAFGINEMAFAAIIVGLARSIYLVLQDGMIIDTIVYGLFNPLQDLPVYLSAVGMMISHLLIHIPIPSSSGHAVLTMPLLTPLSDLIGMSRQVMILCYQYGGIIMDMITPTNGALLAILTAAGVSYKDWLLYCWRPFGIILGISLTSITIAIFIGL